MSIASKQHIGNTVKSSAYHQTAALIGQLSGTPQHLLGCLAGEGEQQNILGTHSLIQQIGNPVHKGTGLAASGSCNDQNRALGCDHCLTL